MSTVSAAARRARLLASRPALSRSFMQRKNIIASSEPGQSLESIQLPPADPECPVEAPTEPHFYNRKPVTSAHAIDFKALKLSARDSAVISPSGTVVHGRYGDLGPDVAQGIPLEYLALLRPAAEGAAALRVILEKAKGAPGTLLVYGATQPNGMAAVQLASSSGNAVIAVVDGGHAGHEEMMDVMKGLAAEPGTAVTEEYAYKKKNFDELVDLTINGDYPSKWNTFKPDEFLKDFKENLLLYAKKYPSTLPAAVDKSQLDFTYADKDREFFKDNMDTYLSQFPAGADPVDPAKLDTYFDTEQYAAFKAKFSKQTTAVITGDDVPDFNAPDEVQAQLASPATLDESLKQEPVADAGPFVPYDFSVLKQDFGPGVEPQKGGPLLGAVIVVTPTLAEAAAAVEKAGKSLRAKAEALSFLTASQKTAFGSAMSIINQARQRGAPVYCVGGTLPGLDSVGEPTDDDVQEALAGMEIDENGNSRINYFVQVYRAGDFPVYADYAIHRATEELAGPRQIVVTK